MSERRRNAPVTHKIKARNGGAYVILTAGAVFMVFPFIWQFIISLESLSEARSYPPTFWPANPSFAAYGAVFTALPIARELGTSALITLARTAGQLVFCSLAGYAFARLRFRGRGLVFGLFLSVLMVPGACFLIPQYQIIQTLGWVDTWQGVALPGLFSAFGTFLMRQFFAGLPRELEEAARLDGAGTVRTFVQIMLPLAKPGLIAMTILTVLWSWNDMLWPLIVTTNQDNMPISAALATLHGEHMTEYPMMMAGALIAMAPIVLLFVLLQRQFIEGIAFQGSSKG